ncbi:MAG: glycosyltransferase family 39 protein [Armatimonadetes bacterium]|nr:glycosyltransferase family 39 protein [Armatimonadota bacterium]
MSRPLLLIVLAAAGLRLWRLGASSLTGDEAGCMYFGAFPLNRLVEVILASHEVHPPGFFALVHMWTAVGWNEAVVRFPSAVFGIGTVLAACWLFRAWDPEVALPATLLMAVGTYPIQASRELRMYSLLALLITVALGALYRWLRSGRIGWLAVFSGCTAVSFWIHYLSFFALPVAFSWVLACRPRWSLRWMVAVAVAGLPFCLWLPTMRLQAQSQNMLLRPPPGPAHVVELLGRMAVGDVGPVDSLWLTAMGAGALLLVGVALRRRPGEPERLALLWLAVPIGILFLLSVLTSARLFEFKYFSWAMPGLAWLLVRGLQRLGRAGPWVLGGIVVLNLINYWTAVAPAHRYGPDWRTAGKALRQWSGPEVLVLVHPSMMAQPLIYYGIQPQQMQPVDALDREELGRRVAGHRTVYLVTTPNHPFVIASRLEWMLDEELVREQAWELPARLPSGVIRLIRYRVGGP